MKKVFVSLILSALTCLSYAQTDNKEPQLLWRGIDLAKTSWYASATLPPHSEADEIRARGTLTTPTVTLRSPVKGGEGTLFTIITLPSPLPPGVSGRITIGDINGDDETFFNGQSIGATKGIGGAEFRTPRVYTIPANLIKPGENILSLKVGGSSGQQIFGIRSAPLTFAFVPTASLPPATATASSAATVFQNIADSIALEAIKAADSSVDVSQLIKKRPGFGRFGELYANGLPAVSDITPTHISVRNSAAFDIILDTVQNVGTVPTNKGSEIDVWHHKIRVNGKVGNSEVSYKTLQHVHYPGTILSLEKGNILKLRVKFPKLHGQVVSFSRGESQEIFGDKAAEFNAFTFVPLEKDSTPAFMISRGLSVNLTQSSTSVDISLARQANFKGEPKAYIVYPAGLDRFDFSSRPTELSDIADIISEKETTETLRQWVKLAVNEPAEQAEWFQVREGEKFVRIYQLSRYISPLTAPELKPYTFLPPQVEFARERLDFPVDTSATSPTQIMTFSGYLHHFPDAAVYSSDLDPALASSPVYVGWYDLPIPELHNRALPEITEQSSWKEVINKYALSALGTSSSLTAVDALYKSRTQAYQAYSFLTPENKAVLSQNSLETVRESLRGHFWQKSRERFSGLEYIWTHFVQGPFFEKYEMDWGNGLSLYGLAIYAIYSGDTKPVAENWNVIRDIYSWFIVSDDWEWMRGGNASHGHGTGFGDAQNATYAASVAYARLANLIGDETEYRYGLYNLARSSVLSLNKFVYNEFATAHSFKGDNSIILGFHEGKGFLEGELERYPWGMTSNIAAAGVQSENFDLYLNRAADILRNYELNFEKAFPSWADGTFKYPYTTSYSDNSGQITLPHIYLRARQTGDSFASLNDLLNQAIANPAFWWISPPVIAEVLSRRSGGVAILGWDKARFLGGSVSPDTERGGDKRRVLTLAVDNMEGTNTVSIKLPRRPSTFQINNGPVPLTDSRFEDGVLKLRLRRPGENTIKVHYAVN